MRKTITLTAPNGAKVRTVHSKRYFVVSFREVGFKYDRTTGEYTRFETPQPIAEVRKRTDALEAAEAEVRLRSPESVIFDTKGEAPRQLDQDYVRREVAAIRTRAAQARAYDRAYHPNRF